MNNKFIIYFILKVVSESRWTQRFWKESNPTCLCKSTIVNDIAIILFRSHAHIPITQPELESHITLNLYEFNNQWDAIVRSAHVKKTIFVNDKEVPTQF